MASMAALQSSMASLSVGSYGSSTIFGSSLQQARSQGQVTQNGALTVRMAVKRWEKKKLQPNGLPVRQKIHVRVGDTVQVIAGRDKGKISEVTQVYSHNAKVLCKDVNVMTKHVKPRAEGESGQIIQIEAPIHSSNVMVYSKESKVASRVGHKILENGTKVRFLLKTGEVIDDPKDSAEKRLKKVDEA